MPDFNIVEGRRFDGEFSLDPDPNHAPTTAEQAYLDALHRVMDSMAQDHDADPTGDDEGSVALRQARVARRNRALQELQAEAAEFIAGHLIPEIAADNAFVIRGRYVADIERLTGSFFLVERVIDRGQVQDVIIYVSEELPLTRDPAASAKQALYVALVNARTVVKTVARRI